MATTTQSKRRRYSQPRWRVTRWLADAGPGVPDEIRQALIAEIYGSLPVLAAGAINAITVAAAIAIREPTVLFLTWLVLEVVICLTRLAVTVVANRAARERRPTPTDLHIVLSIAWSMSVGFGTLISFASGDWVVALLAAQSAAAMVGGICFRHFSAPRLAGTMILLSLGPEVLGIAWANEPFLYIVFMQMPLYLSAMTVAAFRLNKMLVATMRAERENGHLAHHDTLTDLHNRAGFVTALKARLKASAGDSKPFALLFLDLDDFKPVNDTYGHAAGDQVLVLVAERLRRNLSETDVIARLGGDEFVVLANRVDAKQALAIGQRIIRAVTAPYQLADGVAAKVGVSVGVAVYPEHGTEAEELLAIADFALYEAKSEGKARCRVASMETNIEALRRLTIRDATATVDRETAA